MKLLVHTINRTIHAASNLGTWQVPPGFEILDVPGDAETFAWPNGAVSRAMLDIANNIIANPAWQAPIDKKALALTQVNALPANAIKNALLAILDI